MLIIKFNINKFPLFHLAWSVFLHCLIMVTISLFSRKYIGQIFTDCLVHDEKALKYLVDTIGEVRLQRFYWPGIDDACKLHIAEIINELP